MKKLFVFFLALGMLLGLCACGETAQTGGDSDPAQETVDLDDLEWENTDEGIEITNYKGNAKRVVIPDTIENKKVVSIGEAFCGNVTVETLVLSKNIEKLDGDSLANCDGLKRLEAPGVTRFVGDELDLDSLEELVLPALKKLELNDIEDCERLRYLEVPAVEYIRAYRSSNKDMLLWPDSLEEVVIPEGMWAKTGENYYDWDDEDPGYPMVAALMIPSELDYEDVDPDDLRYGHAYTEITAEYADSLYCYFFQADFITVNGELYQLER